MDDTLQLLRDIADRLTRLEASVAASGGVRLTRADAAALLRCSLDTVDRYASRGLLVRLPKASPRHATYFDAENVKVLARSEDAAREWVARRKYVPLARRA